MTPMQIFLKSLALVLIMLLYGCGDPIQGQIDKQIPLTESKINALADALSAGSVRNATLINQYVEKIKSAKPELATLADEFAKDATTRGPMYQSLLERLDTVKNNPQMFSSKQDVFDELVNLYQAADPMLYSDALSDPLNVLADMSGGLLPRVNSLSRDEAIKANKAQDFGVGSQLIGNPGYGYWNTGSDGTSFWVWYGMFRMMDDLFDSRRKVYYHNWGSKRGYSYYHDYGRKRYTSPSKFAKQSQLDTRTRKQFGNKGFKSAYSKNRTGASSLSRQSKAAQTSSNRFRSTSANRSSYAKNSSFRNSSSSTSRGVRRGK